MARVLHVMTRYLRGGGAERNLLHYVRWQRTHGHQVDIAMGADSYASDFPGDIGAYYIPDLVRPVRPQKDVQAVRGLARLIETGRYDVVHTHESKAGIIGRMAARNRAPVIVHSVHIPSFGRSYPRSVSAAFLAAEQYCARFTSAYIAVGHELQQTYLQRGLGDPGRSFVIHSPIAVQDFLAVRDYQPQQQRAIRASFGIAHHRPLVVAVGTLEPRKRHLLLLRRLARPLREGRAALALAGDGPLRQRVQEEATALGVDNAVHLLGHCDRVPALMGIGSLLAHTSSREGVPQVVIQALAAGLPVVATEAEGLREIAGAPVTVVNRSGQGLAAEVMNTLDTARPPALPAAAFEPWTRPAIEQQIAAFHEALAALPAQRPAVRPVSLAQP